MEKVIGLFGLGIMFWISWSLSTARKKISWKTVGYGTLLQLVFAFCLLKTEWGRTAFGWVDFLATHIMGQAKAGAVFLFSSALGDAGVAEKLFGAGNGFIFAFQALPALVFMSALTALLYHIGLMQWVIRILAKVMWRFMGISGAESCCAAANVFLGQTEAPLLIRPFLGKMTKSELHSVMVGGMATISGSVLAAYIGMLTGKIEGVAAHFIAASVMSAPAALVFAKLLVPETESPDTQQSGFVMASSTESDAVSAFSKGCADGVSMAINVAAMLLGFISGVALLQWIWNGAVAACGGPEWLMIESILGYVFAPFAFLLGIPAQDILSCGRLLGEKTLMNEFIAYVHLAEMLGSDLADSSERTRVIMSYALCGFANISSIGVLLGGLGSIIPERKQELARLSWRALLGGTFASFSTAIIAGLIL